jgi:hypothetical protein
MPHLSNTLKVLFATTLCAMCAGCCDDEVRDVSTSFSPVVWVGYSYTWVGDTATVYADAIADPTQGLFCSGLVYSSAAEPRRFHLASTDTTIATVNDRALFTARAVGRMGIVTTTAGVSDTLPVVVGPAFASLRITPTPATARVGDTLTLQLDAVDSTGTVVTGAEVQLLELLRPSDSLAVWIRSDRAPRPFPSITFQSPVFDRLVLLRPGVLRVLAAAPHDTGRPLRYVADTVIISVAVQ